MSLNISVCLWLGLWTIVLLIIAIVIYIFEFFAVWFYILDSNYPLNSIFSVLWGLMFSCLVYIFQTWNGLALRISIWILRYAKCFCYGSIMIFAEYYISWSFLAWLLSLLLSCIQPKNSSVVCWKPIQMIDWLSENWWRTNGLRYATASETSFQEVSLISLQRRSR